MAHTYDELNKMTVAQLRELAASTNHEAVQGHTQMQKDQIVLALCTALGIDAHEHHHVVGLDKPKTKAQIRALKAKRTAAIESKDRSQLKRIRRAIRRLKHKIRRATV